MDAVSAWLVPAAVNGVYQIDDLDEWLHGGIGPRCHQPTDRCDLRAKINIHEAGHEIDLKTDRPVPCSADLCLLVRDSLDDVVAALREHRVSCLGPVSWTGAHGAVTSVYVRDPDRNLIELSGYDQD